MKLFLIAAAFIAFPATSPALARQAVWKIVPNRMADERWAPGYCVLHDGKTAIIAGGYSYAKRSCVASIDLFDESAGRFRHSKALLSYPRDFVQANLLPDGKVLLSGGYNDVWASMNTADIYDPATDTCRLISMKMNQHRELFQTVTLGHGCVLLIGGLDLWARHTVGTAEIFDPKTERFTPTTGQMAYDRFGQAACKLRDGRVLVVGGTHWNLRTHETRVLDSAEIYDPAVGRFYTTSGRLISARDRPTASLLASGKVLIYGGQGGNGAAVVRAELFDPQTEQFTEITTLPLIPRMAHGASTLAANDRVLITGGWDSAAHATTPTDLQFNADDGRVMPLPDLPFAPLDAAQVVFSDGVALVAGGKSVKGGKATSIDEGAVSPASP